MPPAKLTAPEIRVTSEPPDTSTALDGERKTVTALFADIKGSMELMEDIDPEEARRIVDPALKLMMDAVHHYDGYIVQSTGDGVFALFGAPVAHEDHPQRALYAALRMQEDLKRYSERTRAEGRLPIQVRVGVNTGEVVVRVIKTGEAHSEYTPIGHSTSLAARMQALAPIGSIAATEQVRKLCEGYFAFKALGPTKVKGVTEPVNVYEVTGFGPLRTRLQRSASRGYTKFVGRRREMEAMKAAAEQAMAGHGQTVAAVAEPGVGKSRLFYEFKAVAQSGWMVLETFSVSHGKATPYLPVIDLLRNYFKLASEDDERARREKVGGRVLMLDRALEDTLPYVFPLLAVSQDDDLLAQMDPVIRKRRTLDAIKRLLLRESLNQPLMLVFEDLHWIDDETQALLNLLADSIGTAKVLLMVNYRPEYTHSWGNKTYYTQLRLDPLGREGAGEMLDALLGSSAPLARSSAGEGKRGDEPRAGEGADLAPVKRLIIEKTEGNPFFMEELVQALFDEGVLVRNGAVKVTRSLSQLKIPPTVQGILAARIDRLPPEEKELLQTLAVIGTEFPLGLVKGVLHPHPPGTKPGGLSRERAGEASEELERMLADLQLGEFIYEQPAASDIEYTFKHALTHDVAYNSLLVERRKLLHERAGQALESMFAEQLDDHLGQLAHHYSRSDNVSKAVEYLGRAGQQAIQRSAYADAISSLNAAIDLLQRLPDSPERIQRELLLQLAFALALSAVKGYSAPEAERAYTRARELCERLGDPPEHFPALFGLWVVYFIRAEFRRAYELAEQLLRRAQSAHDPALLVYTHYALGATLYSMGKFLLARKHHETAISLYDRERHRPLAFRVNGIDAGVLCLSRAAWTLWTLGYPDQALKRGLEAVALAQALSHPHSLAGAEWFLGVLHQLRREAGAAQETAERAIALSAEHGLALWLALATILRGLAMAQQGRNEEGIAQMQEGLAAHRATGAQLNRPYFLSLLAEACGETGRLDAG